MTGTRYTLFASLVLALVLALWITAPRHQLVADAPAPVVVTNLPDVQPVSGTVSIAAPIPSSEFVTRTAVVSPASPSDVSDLTVAGPLETAGYTSLTAGISGIVQGTGAVGEVGAILVPDHPDILASLNDHARLQLPLRVDASVAAGSALFDSRQVTHRLLFPRYRVFFYNETARTVEMTLYLNLASSAGA